MARIVKVKNNSGLGGTWLGVPLANGLYYQIPDSKINQWILDNKVFTDVGNGNLVVNNGADTIDDIIDVTKGWAWLTGNTEPQKTADGDWHFVQENFAHVTGNNALNWTIEKSLDANTSYTETMIIPNNRTLTLNFLEGGAFTVPTHIKLEWLEDIGGGVFIVRNPEIRLDEIRMATVNGIHSATSTTITMYNSNGELSQVEPNLYYGFKDGSNATFYRQVTAIDTVANTVTLSSGLPASTGITATGTVTLTAGAVSSITITDGGTMYSSTPTVTISGDGTGATGTAVLANGVVTSVTIDTGGTGYTTSTILFSAPDGSISDGTFFGLTERVIGQKSNQVASSVINWVSPPQFYGNGVNYLRLTITNEDTVDSGLVTAMVNGWHTDSTTGD